MTKVQVVHSVIGHPGKNYSLKTHLKFVSIVFKFFCALSGEAPVWDLGTEYLTTIILSHFKHRSWRTYPGSDDITI